MGCTVEVKAAAWKTACLVSIESLGTIRRARIVS
jgi:hypothetical protein